MNRRQAKVLITEVNSTRRPPIARAREVLSGASLTISLDIGRSSDTPVVGEVWWVQSIGTRWALYAKVYTNNTSTSAASVARSELDLFFQVREKAVVLSYYPVVKFNKAAVSGTSDISHYIISWTKCKKNGGLITGEKAQQYVWNPNERADGDDEFVDIEAGTGWDFSVEVPFEVDNAKVSYYKARIRGVAKDGYKGAWSEWTKPKIPIRNSIDGPPPVEDLELNFEAKETNSGKLDYRAIVSFKDVGYWDVPGYDFEDDVAAYDVQLQPLEKVVKTYGTLDGSLSKTADEFYVIEKSNVGLPSNLSTAFDVQIGNEIIGIASRQSTATQNRRKYNVAERGKYSTIAVGHVDEAAVKEYNIDVYDELPLLKPIAPDKIPALRETITNKDEASGKVITDINDVDQDDTVQSWPKLGNLNTEIKAARLQFNVSVSNAKLLDNLPKILSPFAVPGSPLFKIVVRNEIMGVTDWSYNSGSKVLSLTTGTSEDPQRGIDGTQADDHRDNAKVRINSWLPIGYLQEDMTEESDTITIVEDRILDFDSNDDGLDETFLIRINDEKMQVYARGLKDTFVVDNHTYYVYEYEIYRAIQNTEISAHVGGTESVVEIDMGYYYSVTFETIPQPTKIYWRARVRAQDRFSRFGPWSDWTDPIKASEDADDLAPAPTGVALNFKRKHRNREWTIKAEVSWDKVSYEIPGGDTVEDVKGYQSRLLSSDGSKLAEPIGLDVHTVTARYLTDNIAYLVLDPTYLTEYSFSAGQRVQVSVSTTGRATVDALYNGSHRVLDYDFENRIIAFYKEYANLDLEDTTGTATTPQTIIKVYEPEKTNSTQRQLGSDGVGYIFLTSHDLPQGIELSDAENKDYYEMMYVKDSWESLTGDYHEYFVARGVLGTKARDFGTQWMLADTTEPIKPMLIFTYPATFEATKLVNPDEQELEPYGGVRYTQVYGPVRRQFWYLGQVRTLDTYNRVGDWSVPSSPATALDNVRPPQPYNINVIPYTNYVKVDWDIQSEPGVISPFYDVDQDGELDPDDFEVISTDVSYFKVQLWSEDPHAEAPDEQEAFGLNGDPVYSSGTVTLTTDQTHTFTVGESVVIKGCWPNGINGEHVVTSVPTVTQFTIAATLTLDGENPYQIDGLVYKKGEMQALDLYKQYPIHFFRRNSLDDLKSISLAEKGDICQVSGEDKGFYELTSPNYRLLSNWKKIKKERVQIPGLLFYDRYVNLTSRNVPVKKLTNKVWARVCSVDEAGNQSEWISAGPFNTEFIPGPEWVLTKLIHKDTAQLDAKVQWAEVTSQDFTVGAYNIELQSGRLYAQLYNDSMDFWGLDPAQDIVVGMVSNGITAESTDTTLNVTEFNEAADVGEYIKIGDELLRVTHREASDDINGFIDAVYTVERGAVGTTPTVHDTGVLILKVQSEAIIVRELFTPAANASLTTDETYQIVIGNERMTVLDRVAYTDNDYNLTIGSTSPTSNPYGTWSSAGTTGIGTVGTGSSTQSGSSAMLYQSGTWVAATSTGIWTSTDLTTWTSRTTNVSNLRSLATDGSRWLTVGDGGQILTALDPTGDWTASSQTPFGTDDIYGAKYGNGVWTIVGENNKIAYAFTPTSTWTLIDPNIDVSLDILDKSMSSGIVTVTIAANTNIAVGSSITVSNLGYLYDGEHTVTAVNSGTVNLSNSTTLNVTTVSYETSNNNSQTTTGVVADPTFSSTPISTSPNVFAKGLAAPLNESVNFQVSPTIAGQASLSAPPTSIGLLKYALNINSIAYGAGYWAAACNEGKIATAANPAGTWTVRTTPTTQKLNSIAYSNGYWVAAGNSGTLLTATNPTLTWTTRTTGLTQNLHDASYGASKWVAVGASGKVLVASNPTGIWSSVTSGTTTNLYSAAFGLGSTTSEWAVAGTNGLVLYAGTTNADGITGNLWVYLVLRDRTWGSSLVQIEDFQHPDLTPIFDTISVKTATRTGAEQADRDDNDYWNYVFANVPPTLYYRSRVQGVLKSGIKGNWSNYTLWADPNDLTAPPAPYVNADFDAKILDVSWIMPNDIQNQVFRVDDQAEMLELSTAKVGDIAVYTTVVNSVTTVYAYRLTALPASDLTKWAVTLSPIDDQGNPISVANDYLYKANSAAFYQVQVARIPKKWKAVGSLGRTLENIPDGSSPVTFKIDPGQKLDKYPKVGDKIQVGPGALIEVVTIRNGLNEVQQIRVLRNATGNFKLSFRGNTTDNIATTASAATVETALRGLTSQTQIDVTKPDSTKPIWTVKFTGTLGTQTNIPQIVANDSGLSSSVGGKEIMTLSSVPTDVDDWQKATVTLTANRSAGGNYYHSKGALVQWMKPDGTDFYDPVKPFKYRWIWKDDRFITDMSKTYMADNIKNYLYVVRVRAADAAGNFSDWSTEFVSPSGVPTPDVTDLEFADIDNTPDTLEGILTFIGSMDASENISSFVTELMPTQQIRLLNDLTASGTTVYVKKKKKVLNPSSVGDYVAYLEDEQVLVTARAEDTYKGNAVYKLTIERGYNDTTAAAHQKNIWIQWFHHFTVKETIDGVQYNPSLDASVDADAGTIISSTPPALGQYKTIFNGIKSGRWYKGRAKAVTDEGKSSAWSDWSEALRGEKGSSLSGGSVPAPKPVRNLIIDVDAHKIHLDWLPPKFRETDETTTTSSSTAALTAADDLVTFTGHGYELNDVISFISVDAGLGLTANASYYVINPSTDTFQLSLTADGSAIDILIDGEASIDKAAETISVVTIEPYTGLTAPTELLTKYGFTTEPDYVLVTTASAHHLTYEAGDLSVDEVKISGGYAPFQGTFPVFYVPLSPDDGNGSPTTFVMPIVFSDTDATSYPIEGGTNNNAVISVMPSDVSDGEEIDHYIVSIKRARKVNGVDSPTWAEVKSGKFWAPAETDKNVKTTHRTFKVNLVDKKTTYYAKVIAVNSAGKKSEPRYARGNRAKPPTPTIESVTIMAAREGRKYNAKVKIRQDKVVTDKDITKYRVEYFVSKNPKKDPATVDNFLHRDVTDERVEAGKKIKIGQLYRKRWLYLRAYSQNADGVYSYPTKWKRIKIVTS